MKYLLLPLAVLLVLTYSFITPQFTSQLTIKPHEQFFLGGGQRKSISAYAKNVGMVPVTISVRMNDGSEKELIILQPGKDIKAEAPAKAAMLFFKCIRSRCEIGCKGQWKTGVTQYVL